MRLKVLIKSIRLNLPVNFQDFEVKGITSDSRKVKANFIFVAIKGNNFDGHEFVQEAIQKGAKVVVIQDSRCQRPLLELKRITQPGFKGKHRQASGVKTIAYIKVVDTRQAIAKLIAQFYGQPSENMKIVGITGTNGKTTVSYLIEVILKSAQFNPAVIGTINYRFKERILRANNTTPGPEHLQAMLAQMLKEKIDYVIIEVSSHALDQERVCAVKFSTGIFTNLSREHLDYHRDLDSYFVAKSELFKGLPKEGFAILNADDSHARRLIKLTEARVVTYGILSDSVDITAQDINPSLKGTEFVLYFNPSIKKSLKVSRLKLSTSLIGRHNIYNILAAVAFGITQGIDTEIIREAIERFTGVPGRLERIATEKDFSVFVDYAHTEDALKNVIRGLRPLCKGRLCVVFGCGGSRDKTKRPKMGRIVSELADLAIITSDNPRSEEPKKIINEVVSGINKKNFRVVVNRRQAIKEALSGASKNDIILIAGKGHENYQIFKDKIIHFDDREVVRECLRLRN